jgi:2-iminobutanoate/2-iminopropanoate deaminase
MSKLDIISTDQAPEAIGPYSQAVKFNDLLFLSGQIPLDPVSMEVIDGDVATETKQVLENITQVLTAADLDLSDVVKTTLYISDMDQFEAINQIYGQYFSDHKPARSCVEVAKLPKDVKIEMEVIAAY